MRLAECLNQSDIRNLRKIAQRHTLDVPLYSKNSLLQEILARFCEPSYIAKRTEHLSAAANAALLEIALDAHETYTREEITALLARVQTPDETPQLLEELLSEGIVYATGSTGKQTYVCPSDIWRRLHRITADKLRQSVQTSVCEPRVFRHDAHTLARDAVTLLLFVARQTPRLTQDGVIFKRQQAQLLEILEVEEEPLAQPVGWRFGFGRRFHDYPDRLALLYDHLYAQGCLVETVDGLVAPADVCELYTKQPEDVRAHKLFRYWIQSYRTAIPSLPRLAARIAELTAKDWVYADSLFATLEGNLNDYYYEPKERVFTLRIMQMLVFTGAMMVGQGDADRQLYKLSAQGAVWLRGKAGDALQMQAQTEADLRRSSTLAIIQPTFEVLVPPEGDAVYGWDLQQLATLTQSERMRHYELTRESVYKALQAGWDEQRMLSFLRKIGAYELPGNVERTLIGWCQEFGRIKVEVCCVITCKDAATRAEIEQLAPLSQRVLGTLGDTALVLPSGDQAKIASTLQKLGYLVQVQDH